MAEEKPTGAGVDCDPFITGATRFCKNPMHKADSKARASDYCLACKNPRHNPGHLAAVLLQHSQKGATLRHCKNPEHQHVEEPLDEFLPVGASGAEMPVLSVKDKTGWSMHPSQVPVFWKVALPLAAAIFLLAVVFIFFDDFWRQIPPNVTTVRPPGGVYYCTTVFCDREADRLKSLLSGTTGPCDDFYQHVCDNWVRSQSLASPETGTAISSDTIIQDDLITTLEAGLVSKKRQDVSVALALYDACTDRAQSGRALAAMAELFRRWKIGRWPTDALASPKEAWFFAGELIKDIGSKALVDVFAAVDADEPAKVAIGLGKPKFLFSCNDATRPGVVNMFRDALAETMSAVSQASSQLIDEIMLVITRLGSSPLEPADSEIGMRGFDVIRLTDLHSGIVELLRATFENDSSLRPETKIVLKSADYLQGHLVTALRELPPRAVMNYLGFQAFITLAPFFLDRHRLLRQLFSKSFLGRTLPDVSNTSRLCLVAVERVLPGCFARMLHLPSSGALVVNKLSQLVGSFGRSVEHLAWMDDMAVVLTRYLLKEYTTSPSGDDAPCPSSSASFAKENSIKFFVSVSRDRQQRTLRVGGGSVVPSQLLTFATHDFAGRRVHIPAALFNASVPANTSHFSLHFSRFAVRFYRALVEAALRRDTVPASLRYGDDPVRRFEELLNCFEWELRQLPVALRQPIAPDSMAARGAVLQQTVAVQLAFRAFQELLQIRRTWNLDFRFAQLPALSVDQLFFVYYALDNCEAADRVYQEHRGQRLPARYRVNVPLRNVVEFPEVFGCAPHSNMVRFSFVPACTVVSVEQWLKSQPE
ncbi:hypothetical protein V5799_009838 [Amblyomma americanum]|uniref:M13 family peptidase n=1 Tax=Amblyomma americanum TaxID=6943 RepID=A0AAQ4FB15_AMBAM